MTAPTMIRSDKALYVSLCIAFLGSRLLFHFAGVRFDTTPLASYWQYLDPRLLETDLLRSLVYLHSQPPLFNLFLGFGLKSAPVDPSGPFRACYVLAGWVTCLSTCFVMRRLGVSKPWAFVFSALLVIRPCFILMENRLTYDLPVTALLCLAATWLALYGSSRKPVYGHAFFLTLGAVCASRSLFHPLYFAAVVAAFALMAEGRRWWRMALIPAGLLVILMVKNFVLFGQLGTSSWLGMNLWRIASTEISAEELTALQEEGHLSGVASIRAFSRVEAYPAPLRPQPRHPDVPAVAAVSKSTGATNYNHESYLRIARHYLRDALWIVRHRPGDYLRGMAKAWYYYFSPQTLVLQLKGSRERIAGYARFGEVFLHGRLPWRFRYGSEPRPIYLFSTLGISALLIYSIILCVRREDARLLLVFLAFTALYVALAGNSSEVLENQRFRFYTDPFLAVFLALAVTRLNSRFARRGSRKPRAWCR